MHWKGWDGLVMVQEVVPIDSYLMLSNFTGKLVFVVGNVALKGEAMHTDKEKLDPTENCEIGIVIVSVVREIEDDNDVLN